MREPTLLEGRRFRFDELSFADAAGKSYPGFLFRPCDASCTQQPAGLESHEPPYPAVVIMHGGAANHEMYLWAAEGLAEAGYMSSRSSSPRAWTAGTTRPPGPASTGCCPRPRSPMPDDLGLRTPALFFTADYNCQRVPVCLPERYAQPPDPLGPGNKDEDFRRLRAAGVDTMKIALRAAVHLDWTEWPELNGSRYGVVTTLYYTRAWFDRYLKGEATATQRLVAGRFDDSADVHSISSGRFDPQTLSNLAPTIEGQPVVDRLSFHFRSGYWLEEGLLTCERMRDGC